MLQRHATTGIQIVQGRHLTGLTVDGPVIVHVVGSIQACMCFVIFYMYL